MFFLLNRFDGSGSIILTMLYVYAFCFKYKIDYNGLISDKAWWYLHSNFIKDINIMLGINNIKKDRKHLEKISFFKALNYSKKNSNNIYTNFDNSLYKYFQQEANFFFDNSFNEHIYNQIAPLYSEKYILDKTNKIISVHIRRGDVTKNMPIRYTHDIVYKNLIGNIIKKENLKNYEIHFFSNKAFNGNIDIFKSFQNVVFHLENQPQRGNNITNILNDLNFMIYSDYLICSKSAFSYVPAILNSKGKIY